MVLSSTTTANSQRINKQLMKEYKIKKYNVLKIRYYKN